MSRQAYILPYKERQRLHGRAYRAQQRSHSEICGVLVSGYDNKIELHFIKNASREPYQYVVSGGAIRIIQRSLKDAQKNVIGTFHSHPVGEAAPGSGDMKKGFYKGLEMIYDVCGREVKLWRLRKGRAGQLKEIPLIMESRKKPAGKKV